MDANKTTSETESPHSIKTYIKRLIIGMAIRNLLPIRLADLLIQRGGLSHE